MTKILIIAEAGISHQGSISLAKNMIEVAKICGADIWKTQLYDVDKLFPDKRIMAQNRNWYEEVKKTQLDKEQVFELANYCKVVGIEFLASCFDLERLSWLEEAGVKRHKVASKMNRDRELILGISSTNKEILVSSKLEPLTNLDILTEKMYKRLYCIPNYPTLLGDLEFRKINFPYIFQGISLHYPGIEPALMAAARGAKIIEVHFCLSRKVVDNPDITSSLEPNELKELVRIVRIFEEML